MARTRRGYSRNYRSPANYNWDVASSAQSGQTFSAGKAYLLAQIGPVESDQYTLERILGSIHMAGSSASDYTHGVVYGFVGPDILIPTPNVYAEMPANAPTPLDDEGVDDFPLFEPIALATTTGLDWWTKFGSKAKRVLKKDDCLYIAYQALFGSMTSINVSHIIRCLRKLRG